MKVRRAGMRRSNSSIKRMRTRQEKMRCVSSNPFSSSTPLGSNNEIDVGINISAVTNLFKSNMENSALMDISQGLRKKWRKRRRRARQKPSKKEKQRQGWRNS